MVNWLLLVSGGYYGGGAIGSLLSQWEQQGVFAYVFPFLLIFSIVYGLLSRLAIFTISKGGQEKEPNNTLNAIIALAVALMALQFDVVPLFFAEIFPRLGIGVSILLVVLVLGGLFIPTQKENNWFMVFLIICFFALIIFIIKDSFRHFGWTFSTFDFGLFFYNYGWLILLIVMIVATIASTRRKRNSNKPIIENLFTKLMESSH